MAEDFDLLGDPIPEGRGRRGRPQHIPTARNRNLVIQLLAFGWINERIAHALAITEPTLRKHYFRELKVRVAARDRVDANRIAMLWEQSRIGNVAAIKEYGRLIERNDILDAERKFAEAVDRGAVSERLGKKQQQALAAETAGEGTAWGDDLVGVAGRPN